MRSPRTLRQQLIDVSRRLHARGWVANHDGNVTARAGADRFLATPTATSKADVGHDRLIEVDRAGRVLAGAAKPFGELGLHLLVYGRRDDVGAVVHAHPPHATALACSGSRLLERPFIAEAVVSIGASIPTVEFTLPGPDAADALGPFADDVDAVLLANHGVMAWGADLEQAYLRLELVEHLARVAVLAQATGGVKPLPDDAVAALLARRARAGLGKAADRAAVTGDGHHAGSRGNAEHARGQAAERAAVTVPPPVPRSAPPAPSGNAGGAVLADIVREEILAALRRS